MARSRCRAHRRRWFVLPVPRPARLASRADHPVGKGAVQQTARTLERVAVIAIAGYFADFKFAETGSASTSYILAHLSNALQGLLLTAGSVIPSFTSNYLTIYSPTIATVVGGVLWLAGLAVIASWLVQRRPSGPKAFCVGLIVTSLLFDLLLIPSRLAYDMYSGTASRYDTFMWPLLLGTYAYIMMSRPPRGSRWRHWARVPQMTIALLMGATLVVGTTVGVDQGRVTREVRLTSADILANWQSAPLSVWAPYLLPPCVNEPPYCASLRAAERLLAADHMSIFSDLASSQRLAAEGIVPGGAAAQQLAVPPVLRQRLAPLPAHRGRGPSSAPCLGPIHRSRGRPVDGPWHDGAAPLGNQLWGRGHRSDDH